MKKNRKIALVTIAIILVLIAIAGIVIWRGYQKRIEMEERDAYELAQAYNKQFAAFKVSLPETTEGPQFIYAPYSQTSVQKNRLLICLACYNKDTGNKVTIDRIKEYLSEQYESDGGLRIYTNGLHPDIQNYVEWADVNGSTVSNSKVGIYESSLMDIYNEYKGHNPLQQYPILENLPEEDLKQIIEKEADPSVELNLSVG